MTTRSGQHSGGVQSVERAFELLELLADAGGEATLSELAESSELPMPTIHRLIRTLAACGYVRQQQSRRYALGARLIRLGETAGRTLGAWARPYLTELTDRTGETANMAILDGDQIVYVAQAPSPHAMRMFTEVGRRVDAHSTAAGKAVLAGLPEDAVTQLVTRHGMRRQTERTITDPEQLRNQLRTIHQQGYAVDDGEQELGVRCIAVPVPDAPAAAAISVSGPEARMTRVSVDEVVPLLRHAATELAKDLTANGE